MSLAPRFSPPPSEAGDRATSPALSSSSRTTTSIPTDLSDVSSLDGMEEYEVVEAPLFLTQERDSLTDTSGSSQLQLEGDSSVASEIDASSFLVPAFSPARVGDSVTERTPDDLSESSAVGPLRASTSLTTLHRLDQEVSDSNASSMLRFPDPLDRSFQCDNPPSNQVLEDDIPDDGFDDLLGILTPPLPPHFDREKKIETSQNAEDLDDIITKKPVGLPFSWNKGLIAENIFRAVVGLFVIIISTGVLPTWPSSPSLAARNVTQSCRQPPSSWLGSRGSPLVHPCLEAGNAIAAAPKGLMVRPSSDVSTLSSIPSHMARPSRKAGPSKSKAGGKSRLPHKECSTFSGHLSDFQSQIKGDYRSASVCELYDPADQSVRLSIALRATVPTAFDSVDPNVVGVVSGAALSSAREWSKTASQSAHALSTVMRKEYQELMKEMDERYSESGRRLGALMKPKANKKIWKQILKQHSAVIVFLQRSWLEWMQLAHSWLATLNLYVAQQTTMMHEDWEEFSISLRQSMDKHSKKAAKLARQTRQNAKRMMKQAENLLKLEHMQIELEKGKDQAYRRFQATKGKIRRETLRRKELRMKRDVERRLREIGKLRVKHQEMMLLLEEKADPRFKAARWLKKGKAGLYRKAIQSIQAKHQLEDTLGWMMASEHLPQWTSRKHCQGKQVKDRVRRGKAGVKARRR